MKECQTCGNEILAEAVVCRFCQSPQPPGEACGSREIIRTLHIKANRPTVEEGLARLSGELQRARQAGVRLGRVIHGYGSTGVGGILRSACREFLARERQGRRIKSFVPGEQFTESDPTARALRKRYPVLSRTRRTDTGNPGITFVEL